MKKVTVILAVILMIPSVLRAGTAELFDYDASRIQKAFVDAEMLDRFVTQNHFELGDIDRSNPLLDGLIYAENDYMNDMEMSGTTALFLGFGASCLAGCAGGFLLGCIGAVAGSVAGGLIGVLIASGSGSNATWNAVYGSLAGMLVSVGTLLVISLL